MAIEYGWVTFAEANAYYKTRLGASAKWPKQLYQTEDLFPWPITVKIELLKVPLDTIEFDFTLTEDEATIAVVITMDGNDYTLDFVSGVPQLVGPDSDYQITFTYLTPDADYEFSVSYTIKDIYAAALITAYNQLYYSTDFNFPATADTGMKNAQLEQALFLLQQGDALDKRLALQAQNVTRAEIIGEYYGELMNLPISPGASNFLKLWKFRRGAAFISEVNRCDHYRS